jgi:Domain of unknown function (DUF4331)
MSSHREAPEISKDPVADNTDVYAFRSPGNPSTITIVANFIPGQAPAGGPNFYEFGDDVLYEINIDNDGDGKDNITYSFQFETHVGNPNTFLYNTGTIASLDSPSWNRKQFYSVSRADAKRGERELADHLPCPPCNIGPRSTPNYASLASAAVQTLSSGEKVFAGQRNDPFYVDLGSIFDLADLRPFQNLHLIPSAATKSVDTLSTLNVHTIAIQVPISMLTRDGSVPTDPMSSKAVLGIYASASRRKVSILNGDGGSNDTGPWQQVSRLGNPLFNEVIVPMSQKDEWNATEPEDDSSFLSFAQHPELAKLLPVLYPGVFPNLAGLNASGAVRADLVAILMTGLPPGIIPGFQNLSANLKNRYADLLRLNVAIPPASNPSALGILGGDLAGFPNGRRLADDIIAIELRAVAGATYPLVAPTYTPDAAAGVLTQQPFSPASPGANRYLPAFPYVGTPHDGFSTPTPGP